MAQRSRKTRSNPASSHSTATAQDSFSAPVSSHVREEAQAAVGLRQQVAELQAQRQFLINMLNVACPGHHRMSFVDTARYNSILVEAGLVGMQDLPE